MKPTITVLTCLLLLGFARADVAEIENQFRAAYELYVGKQYQDEVAALDAKYLGALERAMQSATQAGKLEETLVFQDEIQRINDKGLLPEKDEGVAPALLNCARPIVTNLTNSSPRASRPSHPSCNNSCRPDCVSGGIDQSRQAPGSRRGKDLPGRRFVPTLDRRRPLHQPHRRHGRSRQALRKQPGHALCPGADHRRPDRGEDDPV